MGQFIARAGKDVTTVRYTFVYEYLIYIDIEAVARTRRLWVRFPFSRMNYFCFIVRSLENCGMGNPLPSSIFIPDSLCLSGYIRDTA